MTLLFDHMLYQYGVLEREQIVEIDTQIHQLQALPYIVRQNILDVIVQMTAAYKEKAESLQKRVDRLESELDDETERADEEEARADDAESKLDDETERADEAEARAAKAEKQAFKAIAEAKKAKAREKTLRKNVQKICHRQRCAKRLTESYKTKD